jgi:hypothetical protein
VVAPVAVVHLDHACSLHDNCCGRARFREPAPPRSQPSRGIHRSRRFPGPPRAPGGRTAAPATHANPEEPLFVVERAAIRAAGNGARLTTTRR